MTQTETNTINGLEELSKFGQYLHYLKWREDLNRYETWEEAVDDVMSIHEEHLGDLLNNNAQFKFEFEIARKLYKEKKILGSQRILQMRRGILKHNAKVYNCITMYADKLTFFNEYMYWLLCGCGVGFSVQNCHIKSMPKAFTRTDGVETYVIEDSIEGWAESVRVLIESFMAVKSKYFCKRIDFNFSKIRAEGTFITGGYKAPGPEPLKKALDKVTQLLEKTATDDGATLPSIVIYDIAMHLADAVIAGGVRRSATICLFSPDDEQMMNAKIGDWFITNPQRGRSNNSVLLVRDKTSKEQFEAHIAIAQKYFGEPGVVFTDHEDIIFNPCLSKNSIILTKEGIKKLKDIKIGEEIWSEAGWTKVLNIWSTGFQNVYRYRTTVGSFISTNNHHIVTSSGNNQVQLAEDVKSVKGSLLPITDDAVDYLYIDVIDGLLIGDGSVHKASGNLVGLHIGENDTDYFSGENRGFADLCIGKFRPGVSPTFYEVNNHTITAQELPKTYERVIPDRFYKGDTRKKVGFLRGLFSANGSVVNGRVQLKTASKTLAYQVQDMLNSLGLVSNLAVNKPATIQHKNGIYTSKESYNLVLYRSSEEFIKGIGFIQSYKNNAPVKNTSGSKEFYEILDKECLGVEQVYDLEVDNENHTFWSGGHEISNCVEIGMLPRNSEGISGAQGCNLVECNGKEMEHVYEAVQIVQSAALLSTIQASYTNFKYVGKETKEIFEKEALLGVSITGWFNNKNLLTNADLQELLAKSVVAKNSTVAKWIGVNQAARTTCVKPSGNASVVLQTASGVSPEHSKLYFRNVQVNKNNAIAKLFRFLNPKAVDISGWNQAGRDYAISFPVVAKPDSVFKNEVTGLSHLEHIKRIQDNWIEYGTNAHLSTNPKIRHNVSNTVSIGNDEFTNCIDYIYDNKQSFTGISILSDTGDRDYFQAPFTEILDEQGLIAKYGSAAIFASGLIVDALHAFNNVWTACSTAQDYNTENESVYSLLQKDWVRRFNKFAVNYFKGDLSETELCIKDCFNYHRWVSIMRDYKAIDYSKDLPKPEYVSVDTMGAVACNGDSCVINLG